MAKRPEIYADILFSFIKRDDEFPAIKKNKGFSWRGILKVIWNSLKEEISLSIIPKPLPDLSNKIWIYAESINQFRALEDIIKYPETVFVTSSNRLIKIFDYYDIFFLGLKSKLRHRLDPIRFFFIYKKIFKEKFEDHLKTIIKIDGLYEALDDFLSIMQPKAVIMANDHNAFCRALLLVCKKKGIKTIYLQHAAVTDRFPPLNFNLNLLEGQDSLHKYIKAGPINGKVSLVGMTKFDNYFNKVNRKDCVKTIGIALNSGDHFKDYFSLAALINDNIKGLKYIFRFHPSIDSSKLNLPDFAEISYVTQENSFDFLAKIDVLIAGNSSIHLEATLMNVVSYMIKFEKNDHLVDYYGFIENNLIDVLDYEYVLDKLNELSISKPNIRYRAKPYVETINTEWDGNSIGLIFKNINELMYTK